MTDERYAAGLAPRAGWLVFGAGGHARSIVDVLERLGEKVVGVVGDPAGAADWLVPVTGDDDAALARVAAEGLGAVVAIGSAARRVALVERLVSQSAASIEEGGARPSPQDQSRQQFATVVVAATATVASTAQLGAGTVVLEHAHVGPGSRIGRGVIVNTGAVVEHDCVVGDGSHLAPGAYLLGDATVGERTLVGSGARVLPGVSVGSDATIGAGAVVTESVADGATVVGVPARVVPKLPKELRA